MTVSLGCLWRTLDRLGLRLKKSRFVPPTRKASASSAPSPTVIGRRRLSSPACAAMGSLLPSSSWTDQRRMVPHLCREGARTDAAARRHRDPGQARTRSQACARPSRRVAPGCSACRPIRQTSTRSSSSSPSSRHSCARPPPGCALLAMPRRSRRRSACAANAVLVVIPAGGGYHLVQTA